MNNKILQVNEKTFNWLKEQIPTDKSTFSLITYAMNMFNSIKIEINNDLKDNEIKIKEESENNE